MRPQAASCHRYSQVIGISFEVILTLPKGPIGRRSSQAKSDHGSDGEHDREVTVISPVKKGMGIVKKKTNFFRPWQDDQGDDRQGDDHVKAHQGGDCHVDDQAEEVPDDQVVVKCKTG